MSLVFVMSSEAELRAGLPWLGRIARSRHCDVSCVVLGTDRKTLTELTRRKVTESIGNKGGRIQVTCIAAEVDEITRYVDSVRGDLLAFSYHEDALAWQTDLFQRSRPMTIWVRSAKESLGEPPQQILAASVGGDRLASQFCETIFGSAATKTIPITISNDTSKDETNSGDANKGDADADAEDSMGPSLAKTIQASESDLRPDDLVIVGVARVDLKSAMCQWAGAQLSVDSPIGVAYVHDGDTLAESLAGKIRTWFALVAPPMDREERLALAHDLETGSRPNLEFLGLMSAASVLASFGLLQDSAAVIIGAMLIAPLMTPIMGAGLGLAHGNRPLFESSLLTILTGFVGALVASILFGWLYLAFQDPVMTDEMWSRCRPSPLDFCVGLVGGLAASYARTRVHLSAALAGAAIAAALVPPIATAGLQIAFGIWSAGDAEQADRGLPVLGPILLVTVNALTIMIGSSFILWARGMRNETKFDVKTRWSIRVLALLVTLSLMVLIWILH